MILYKFNQIGLTQIPMLYDWRMVRQSLLVAVLPDSFRAPALTNKLHNLLNYLGLKVLKYYFTGQDLNQLGD